MLDAQSYASAVEAAGLRIARDAAGNLDLVVPSCPEMTVAQLVAHTAAFSRWSGTILRTGSPPAEELGDVDDPIAAHREHHGALVDTLRTADPDAEAWTWKTGEDRKRFWFRRAAQELGMHSWDVGNAVGRPLPFDATLAADGIDEMLDTFGAPNIAGYDTVAKVFDQGGRVVRWEATDTGNIWTFKQDGELFDLAASDPEVTARSTASDLLLFVWGRLGLDALEVDGDAELLELWQQRVKI
jgi:uncharacterized protein (TIGR03083 family)